jgi:16S rRNA (uracil1498-N3)-methyltransferase
MATGLPWSFDFLCASAALREISRAIITPKTQSQRNPKRRKMTSRRFYAQPTAFNFEQRTVTFSTDEARHARDVLRLSPGDEIYIFDGQGKEFRGAIRNFDRTHPVVDLLEEVQPAQPESPLQLTLGIALLKGEKFELVIQKTTELGASRIIPLITDRSDMRVKSDENAGKRLARWQRISLEAAKQCGRARLTQISAPVAAQAFLSSPGSEHSAKLFFSERGGNSFNDAGHSLKATAAEIVAVVGPEGGWSDEEIAQARERNWQIITLGGRTMRAETAAIAIVALLEHRFGDLK